MQVFETKFERLIVEKLQKAYQKKADEIANGVPVEIYREQVGYLRALKDALSMVEKARAELLQQR